MAVLVAILLVEIVAALLEVGKRAIERLSGESAYTWCTTHGVAKCAPFSLWQTFCLQSTRLPLELPFLPWNETSRPVVY